MPVISPPAGAGWPSSEGPAAEPPGAGPGKRVMRPSAPRAGPAPCAARRPRVTEADLADVGGRVEPDQGEPGHRRLPARVDPAPVAGGLHPAAPGHGAREAPPPAEA